MDASELRIVPLTVEAWPALAGLFAVDGGGDPRWCWCMYYRRRGRDFQLTSRDENRDALHALATGPRPPGLVALGADGRALGWVAVAPRTEYERIERSRRIPRMDERPVWAVVCFVVARQARGRGVARALLAAAVDHARVHGAPAIEAYPAVPQGRIAAAAAFTGTLRMFEGAGFRRVADTGWATGGVPRVVVRLELESTSLG